MRPEWEARGLTLNGTYIEDAAYVASGGTGRRGMDRGLFGLNVIFDPQETIGIEGGTFFCRYLRHGPDETGGTGEMQGYSNIDTGHKNPAAEIWYEQKFMHGLFRVKAGQVDANEEFDLIAAAGDFINSSAGFSPTLVEFPTYPDAAPGINVFACPAGWFYAGAGLYAENPYHVFAQDFSRLYLLGEAGVTRAAGRSVGPGKVALGVWRVAGGLDRFDGGRENGVTGFYALAEQQVWKAPPKYSGNVQSVSLFAQYGWADANVSPIEHHIGMGVSATGLLPGRSRDTSGLYWSWARTSRATGSTFDHNEQVLELFYGFQVTPFFTLKPDFQWIANPGGHGVPGEACVATLRAIIIF